MTIHALCSPGGKALWLALTATALLLLPGGSHAATTCAEVRAQSPGAGDGTYSLMLGSQQVEVYCHNMASTPLEYLTLPKTGSTTNYSYYGKGQYTAPTGLTTWFSKVRFEPATLRLRLDDYTFSTSQGWANFGGRYDYSAPLATAADCVHDFSQTGRSNIDLTGTPFDIVDQFKVEGYAGAGSANFSGSQIVNLTGGGFCGGIGVPGAMLKLTLRPAPQPAPEPAAELVHRYSFSNGGVDSVSGADATLEQGAIVADGKLVLNGVGAYASLPIGNTIAGLQDATFEAWVKGNELATQRWPRLFDFNDNAQSYIFLTLSAGTSPRFIIEVAGSGLQVAAGNSPFPEDAFTHVAVTMDRAAGLTRLYVNGLEVARQSLLLTPANLGTTSNNWLGRSLFTVDTFFKGSISEFRVYRTALSPRRIAAHYLAGELETRVTARPAPLTNQAPATFVFSSNGTGLDYLCSVDEAAFQPCASPFTTQPLLDGNHAFRVRARDSEGTVEDLPSTYVWTVDLTPPETGISSAPEPESRQPSPSFSFSSDEPGATFECRLDAAPFSECPAAFAPLDDGEHQLEVRARDKAGNVDDSVARHSWTVDTVAPREPALQKPAPGEELFNARPLFSGKAEPDSTVTLFINGVAVGSGQADGQGRWSLYPGSALSLGAHRASAMATDKAGNLSPLPPEQPFSISPRGNYRMGCAASPSGLHACWPWALLLLGLLRPRSRV
ncbi:MAG TPA: LamG-like jellyroll fold domain-containing protein [Myxococcaceae bacterium]|nr:LamG-like jellyroll fold domain-containing protein [Myxococcaceae bacterium]